MQPGQRAVRRQHLDKGHLSAWTGLLSWPRVDSRWTEIEDSCPRGQWGLGT